MQMSLFNYTTLSTRLEKSTRTLFVTLNRPDWNNALKLEMLFELESLLAWCTTRVEINTIFIDSSTPFFSTGLELENLSNLSSQSLDKLNTKLQKIVYSMMQLPQTVIIDLDKGSETLASEFALGADIRIAHQDTKIQFNHGRYGLVPAAGGMSMLATLIPSHFAKKWVLTGAVVDKSELLQSGFVSCLYQTHERNEVIQNLLTHISKQAPVQRIQSKLGLFEPMRNQFENGMILDKKIAKASMVSEDWRNKKNQINENVEFLPAKSMSYAVKLSLIKTEDNRGLDQ